MEVLRVTIEAPVCSFRYPHFLVGRQPSFDMPPPSTVFGHIASTLGEWPDPAAIRFAYWFEARGKVDDLESQHVASPSSGKFHREAQPYPKVLEATVQPTRRQMLFGVRMVLYLNRPDLEGAFRVPTFPVVLGRSQDLASYVEVRRVILERAQRAYLERTLLPFSFRRRTGRGRTVLMPRYIAPPPLREPEFERFILLDDTIWHFPPQEPGPDTASMLHIEGEPLDLWVDPDSPERRGARRAVQLMGFSGEDA